MWYTILTTIKTSKRLEWKELLAVEDWERIVRAKYINIKLRGKETELVGKIAENEPYGGDNRENRYASGIWFYI